jgi:mono/diheme cytochrome c family protein
VAAGATVYANYCAGCHTATVKNNVLNVAAATTSAAIDAAIAKVGSMNSLSAALNAQNKLDLAAYIVSAK